MIAHPESHLKLLASFHLRRLTILFVAILVAACSVPAGPGIVIDKTGWEAVPTMVAAGGGTFTLTVANQTAEHQTFAVIYLYEGEPDSLPMVDGLLDLDNRNRVPGEANFWIVHPEYETREGEGVNPPPLTPARVDSNSETTFTIGGAKGGGELGSYVILSWAPGGYEAGHYTEFIITE